MRGSSTQCEGQVLVGEAAAVRRDRKAAFGGTGWSRAGVKEVPCKRVGKEQRAATSSVLPGLCAEVDVSPRYPDYLCGECASRAVDIDGRPLWLSNVSPLSGGFVVTFADDGTPADSVSRDHIVFVDGLRCWADEARFGGIVIRPAPLPD